MSGYEWHTDGRAKTRDITVTAEQKAAAAFTCARHAQDADDLRELLAMLDLDVAEENP